MSTFMLTAAFLMVAMTVASNASADTGHSSVLDFTMKGIDGKDVPLRNYAGKVIMIVNVASKCGLTPQYEGLQKLYDTYGDRGFVILGFPANNFLWQEPGTNEEIKNFCTLNYGVTFPMFGKISVKGKGQHALYTFLTGKDTDPEFAGAIQWNFTKFLINRSGKIIDRFGPKTVPLDPDVVKAIEQALSEKEN